MDKTEDIVAALPTLSSPELHRIERSIRELYRHRREPILYDDAYGAWTEEDQASAAAKVFALIEAHEGDGEDADA